MRRPILTLTVLLLAGVACRGAGQRAGSDVVSGEQAFERLGCPACHSGRGPVAAPALEGLYGAMVTLENGGQVTADDAYLRESILSPGAKIVSGYGPIMPSYEGVVSDQELEALVEYVRQRGG
jgi:cytochrome c oxidase subunit 2